MLAGARTYDDPVVIDDDGELESAPSTVGRVPSEARGSPVLVLDEGGVEFVPPRGMSGGVGLQTAGVRLLKETSRCPSVRVLEHGDVGGGLWCELPPLHAGADETEERIHGILWVEDARSSSSLSRKRLLHKKEESISVRLRQSHMPKTCKNNFETDLKLPPGPPLSTPHYLVPIIGRPCRCRHVFRISYLGRQLMREYEDVRHRISA